MPVCLILAACGAELPETAVARNTGAVMQDDLSAFQTLPKELSQSNAQLARDFLELTFQLENGTQLPGFTRIEGPIRVAFQNAPPPQLAEELDHLLDRLRSEAGLDIARATASEPAQITIDAIPRATLKNHGSHVACFTARKARSFADYRASTRQKGALAHWQSLAPRDSVLIVLPSDTSPQEMRACLHEEMAHALGPLNDLWRLPRSVLNDDNFHTVLTGFDMLMLQTTYAPELRTGMTRDQLAKALPGVLTRLNPAGTFKRDRRVEPSTPQWRRAMRRATASQSDSTTRLTQASLALRLARAQGWRDTRRAYSHYVLGFWLLSRDVARAEAEFRAADRYYRESLGPGSVQSAKIALHLARIALAKARYGEAQALVPPALAAARRTRNSALLADLLMIQSTALEHLGRPEHAATVRLDSLRHARYGFGSDRNIRARLEQIRALSTRQG